MKNRLYMVLAVLFVLLPFSLAQASGSVVNIAADGGTTVSGAKVMQLAGPTFFARLYWGNSFVRITIKTDSKTKFYRGTGEATTLAEVYEGNMLDVVGTLESGSDSLTLDATSVKNESVQKAQTTFSGTVTAVNLSSRNFTLNTKTQGSIVVDALATTQFTKGSRTLDLEHLKVGDTITKTTGDYDIPSKTLQAGLVVTYVDPTTYLPKNFEGILQSIVSPNAPASIKLTIGSVTYTINIAATASILNNNRGSVLLSRFIPGDTVRVYGAIREVDDPIIDATVVRNTSL